MLGKLIKHEFKTTSRYILLIMAVLVIITPVTALYLRFSGGFIENIDISSDIINTLQSFFTGLCIFLYVIAVIGVAFTTFISLLYRFYKSMISSEGYLTHTLPVKVSSILFSKGLVAVIWNIASFLLIILSILVFTRILGAYTFDELSTALNYITSELGSIGITAGHATLFILNCLLQLICSITTIGACFAIGHRMNGHPILGAIISYIVFMVAVQTITSVIVAIVIPFTKYVLDFSHLSMSSGLYWLLSGTIVYNIIFTIIYSLITVYMFKKKLNI